MNVIEAEQLRKEFTLRVRSGRLRRVRRTVAAVDGVDLAVEAGEVLGYIGPNGAGKSTTLKMMTGILTPSGGAVRVCGLAPVPQRTRLARRIGVVFGQRSLLWWDLPLRESFELLRHIYRVPADAHRARLRRYRAGLERPGPVDGAGATLVAASADGCRLTYALTGVSAGPLVAWLATAGSVRDLSVVEPAIEDVVARLYRSPSGPDTEPRSPVTGAP